MQIQPPAPGNNKGRFGLPNFSGGNGLLKSVLISLAVTVLCLLGLASFMNGGDFVIKKDFTKNLGDMSTTINTVKSNMDTTKKDVSNQLQSVPAIIDTNVNKAVTQYTTTWDGKLTAFTTSVAKTQTDTNTAVQVMQATLGNSINQTNAQINNAVTQASNQWNAQAKVLTDRITALEANYQNVLKTLNDQTAKHNADLASLSAKQESDRASLNSSVNALVARVINLESGNPNYQTRLTNLETRYTALLNTAVDLQTQNNNALARIVSLENRVATLEGNYALTQVSINTSAISYSLVSGATSTIPVLITNSNPTQITVPIRLDLTTSGNVTIVGASMGATNTVTVNGGNATFYTSMTLPANSSITFNIPVALSYNGTSPNTWSAVWSKR